MLLTPLRPSLPPSLPCLSFPDPALAPPNEKVVAEVAAAEQDLRAQLSAFYVSQGYTDEASSSDVARPGRIGRTHFAPVLAESASGAGFSGQGVVSCVHTLARLEQQSAHSEVQRSAIVPIHALALLALGRDEEAVSLLHDVQFIESLQMDDLKNAAHSEDYTVALLMMGFVVYGELRVAFQPLDRLCDHGRRADALGTFPLYP